MDTKNDDENGDQLIELEKMDSKEYEHFKRQNYEIETLISIHEATMEDYAIEYKVVFFLQNVCI